MKSGIVILMGSITLAAVAQDQSVADAAHASQVQKATQATPKKVYTNDDISTSHASEATASTFNIDKATKPTNDKEKNALGKKISADILRQKKQLDTLQIHVDRLTEMEGERAHAQMPATPALESCKAEPERCERPRAATLDLARSKTRLAAAKQKLDATQEKARKLGYTSSVWDPTE